jgi:hypothetical protein
MSKKGMRTRGTSKRCELVEGAIKGGDNEKEMNAHEKDWQEGRARGVSKRGEQEGRAKEECAREV